MDTISGKVSQRVSMQPINVTEGGFKTINIDLTHDRLLFSLEDYDSSSLRKLSKWKINVSFNRDDSEESTSNEEISLKGEHLDEESNQTVIEYQFLVDAHYIHISYLTKHLIVFTSNIISIYLINQTGDIFFQTIKHTYINYKRYTHFDIFTSNIILYYEDTTSPSFIINF